MRKSNVDLQKLGYGNGNKYRRRDLRGVWNTDTHDTQCRNTGNGFGTVRRLYSGREKQRMKTSVVLITCPSCGREKKMLPPVEGYRCICGKNIVTKTRRLFINCECGANAKYLTNSSDRLIETECPVCGQPVACEWNAKKWCYQTIRSEL